MSRKQSRPAREAPFEKARRRALSRLRRGLDLLWTPAASRDELHRRVGSGGTQAGHAHITRDMKSSKSSMRERRRDADPR